MHQKKSVLVTGVPGTGKTTVSDQLVSMGYKSYDLDRMRGLFIMVDKQTRLPVVGHDNADLGKVRAMDWICLKEKLSDIIAKESNPLAFYCGTPSNINEILPLFDKIILLKADEETNRLRLATRTGRNDFGRTVEVQDWIMGWKSNWENEMERKDAIVVAANGDVEQVAHGILKALDGKFGDLEIPQG